MKKVCIITSSHGRDDIRMFQKQTISLSKHGIYVVYVVVDGEKDIDGNNYKITSFGIKAKGKLDRLLSISRKLYQPLLELNADVYQICDPELFPLGVKLKKRNRTVVFDSVEDYEGYYRGIYKGITAFVTSKVMTFLLWRYLNRFDMTLVMSPNIQKRLEKYAPGKVKIVSNYPIISGRDGLSAISLDKYLANNNHFIYSGSVYDFSEQEIVLESINDVENDNAKYLIVGKISEERKKKLEADNIKGRLEVIPWIEREELLKLYRSSICGVVIFDYTPVCCNKEGQMGSNKIFEYMLEGLPVICTDFSLWKSLIIDKYHCGICVSPNNKAQIKEAVRYIIQNKQEAFEMGQRARQAVLTEFNWESQEEKYISIVNSLINE